MADASAAASLSALRHLIADDGYAVTFQTMGQYRTALLKSVDAVLSALPAAAASGREDAETIFDIDRVLEMDGAEEGHYRGYFRKSALRRWRAMLAGAGASEPSEAERRGLVKAKCEPCNGDGCRLCFGEGWVWAERDAASGDTGASHE